MSNKTRFVNLLGRPLKVMRNEADGSLSLFPCPKDGNLSTISQDEAEPVMVDEIIINRSVLAIQVPAPQQGTIFIVPEMVAVFESGKGRNDLVFPQNLREDHSRKAYWCDGFEAVSAEYVKPGEAVYEDANAPMSGQTYDVEAQEAFDNVPPEAIAKPAQAPTAQKQGVNIPQIPTPSVATSQGQAAPAASLPTV